jgi:hypothetical protein
LGLRHTGFSLFRIYADKTTVQQNIQRQCALYSKHFLPICLTVVEDDFTLVLVIQENQRIPTLSSHRTNCKRTQSAKIEIRDKAFKSSRWIHAYKTMPLKFNIRLNMLVLLIIGKNGLETQGLQNLECRSRKERPKKRFSKKLPKLVKKKNTELFFDFEKNYAAILRLSKITFRNRTTQYRIIKYCLPIVSIRTSVQIKRQAFTDRKTI